jgi:hypothetical protein
MVVLIAGASALAGLAWDGRKAAIWLPFRRRKRHLRPPVCRSGAIAAAEPDGPRPSFWCRLFYPEAPLNSPSACFAAALLVNVVATALGFWWCTADPDDRQHGHRKRRLSQAPVGVLIRWC